MDPVLECFRIFRVSVLVEIGYRHLFIDTLNNYCGSDVIETLDIGITRQNNRTATSIPDY